MATLNSGSIKHSRTGKPKSKLGCRTCKLRRVKCDETRPICLRCIQAGQMCVGYPEGRIPSSSWSPPILLPKSTTESGDAQNQLEPRSSLSRMVSEYPIVQTPQLQMFNNDAEYRYFQLFCTKTACRLGGYFNPSLFNHVVLQCCESEPSIRFVVVAIGALDSTLEIGLGQKSEEDQRLRETHHRSALQYYAKAIKSMRLSSTEPHPDMRNTLISCLLCVCFECFNGNNNLAVPQARSGVALFNSWLSKTTSQRISAINSQPTPDVIEDGLIRAFVKLDTDTLAVVDAKPVPMNPATSQESADIFNQMPTKFSDLQEVVLHWDILIRHIMHSMHNMYLMAPLDGTGSEQSVFEMTIPGQEHAIQQRLARLYEDFANYRNAFARWNTGFRPLFEEHRSFASSEEYLAATDLQMRYLAISTPYLGTFNDEVMSDQVLSVHKETISLAEEIIAHTNTAGRASFLFYGSVIGSLYSVGLKCRDPATRRQCISLLKANIRREGLWDSALMARILEIQTEVEEEGMTNGFIPEEFRVRVIRTSYDLQDRSGLLRYRMSGLNRPTEKVKFTW